MKVIRVGKDEVAINPHLKPSPTAKVRILDEDGETVELRPMNRRQRRRLGIISPKRR